MKFSFLSGIKNLNAVQTIIVIKAKGDAEMNNKCGCEKHIKDVKCDVMNCMYHDGDCYCTAKEIAIGPSHATSSTDTVCSTFKEGKA